MARQIYRQSKLIYKMQSKLLKKGFMHINLAPYQKGHLPTQADKGKEETSNKKP